MIERLQASATSQPGHSRPTVLLAAPHFLPSVGGVEYYVANLAEQLQRHHGYRVVVATTHRGCGMTVEDDASVGRIYRLPAVGRVSNTPIGATWTRLLRHIMVIEDVLLVNAHAPVPLFADAAVRAAGRRAVVLTYHTGPMRRGRAAYDTIARLYENTVLARTIDLADEVICSSHYVRRSRPEFERASVISPGADPCLFNGTGVDREPLDILFAATLSKATRYKGLADLLEAVVVLKRTLPGVHLTVAGDGDARAEYETLCRQANLIENVTFVGNLDRGRMADAYRRAAVFALPSRFDSFPTVLVEAMASALPVVSTRVGGIPSVVTDGRDGLLVGPGDVTELADALRRVLTDPARATAMGRSGMIKAQSSMAWSTRASETAEVFGRATSRRRHTVAVVAADYPTQRGADQTYPQRVARAYGAGSPSRWRVVVFCAGARGLRAKRRCDGHIRIVELPRWISVLHTPINPLWSHMLRRGFTRHRVDVVHAHSPIRGLAGLALRCAGRRRTALTYHLGPMATSSAVRGWLTRLYERRGLPRTLQRADEVFVVSDDQWSSEASAHPIPSRGAHPIAVTGPVHIVESHDTSLCHMPYPEDPS